MKTVQLHGVLAEKFGKYYYLDVMSAREATHAIACQIPEFKSFMLKAESLGMRFAVFMDKIDQDHNISESELGNITSSSIIHIVPEIIGSGGQSMAWLQVIAGAALVVVGAGLTPFTAGSSLALTGAGAALMAGGAASLLMPTPQLENTDQDGNRANYGFGRAVTTVAQGNPVPVAYGERWVGGFICSAGIYTEDKQ